MSHVCEKLRGKWPMGEEPSLKRRKIGGLSHQEKRSVSIGAPTQHGRWQMVVSSSSDEDGLVAPPATPAGAEMCEMP